MIDAFCEAPHDVLSPRARAEFRIMMLELWWWWKKPYEWGGQDPDLDGDGEGGGIDCSGGFVESLRSMGWIQKHEDMSADDIWKKYAPGRIATTPRRGAWAFWFDHSGRATHIALCLDEWHVLTADGGGARVKTAADAERANAYVRILPLNHRKSQPRFVWLWT